LVHRCHPVRHLDRRFFHPRRHLLHLFRRHVHGRHCLMCRQLLSVSRPSFRQTWSRNLSLSAGSKKKESNRNQLCYISWKPDSLVFLLLQTANLEIPSSSVAWAARSFLNIEYNNGKQSQYWTDLTRHIQTLGHLYISEINYNKKKQTIPNKNFNSKIVSMLFYQNRKNGLKGKPAGSGVSAFSRYVSKQKLSNMKSTCFRWGCGL
jgi:hypothetical protein